MEKFVEFLTSNLGNSGMKMWILLVAIIAVIIIIGIVVGVLWSKKDKKKKVNAATETVDVESSDEPAITAPPSMQNVDDVAETELNNEVITATAVKLEIQANEPVAKESEDELVSANPPISEIQPVETAPIVEAPVKTEVVAPVAKAEPVIKQEKPSEPIAKVIKEDKPVKPVVAAPIETEKVEEKAKPESTVSAEVAADKAPTAKPVAKKVVAKKIAPATKVDADTAKTTEPKKAKVVGIEALPKKVKNTIKLEEAKTVIETANGESFGKYIIFKDERANPNKPFKFALRANNGQLLFESEPYKVKPRETSIQAFKKHVQIGDFIVDEDKFGFFRYKLYTDAGKLLGVGESYKSRSSCESSIESVKRFSISATVIEDTTLEEVTE